MMTRLFHRRSCPKSACRWQMWVFALLLLTVTSAAQQRQAPPAGGGGQFQIGGTVVNAINDQPLANAYVTITAVQGAAARTVTTGAGGAFRFDGVRAGKYQLSAERRGFASQQYQQHDNFSTAIVAGPGLDSGNIVFRAVPDASFSGRITDELGDAVRNAHVMLIREQVAEGRAIKAIAANASSDDQGHYHFAHLKPGAYYLAVSARPWFADGPFAGRMAFAGEGRGIVSSSGGFGSNAAGNPALDVAFPVTFYPDVTDSASASAITLQAGDRASADFILRAVPALHLHIKNNSPRPENEPGPRPFMGASPSQIIFGDIEVPVPTAMRGVGNGIMTMSFAPGHYLLNVFPAAGRFRRGEGPETNADQEPPASRIREIELVSDTELDPSELPASVAVSGTIKTSDGHAPAKPADVRLRSQSLRRTLNTRASQNGEFTFARGVPAGSYEISIGASDGSYIQSVTATGAKVSGRTVPIGGSEVRLSVVVASGVGRVQGVAARGETPQSGVMIVLVPNDPANHLVLFRRDQSDSDGSFTLQDVVPGRYTLLALEKGWELSWSDPEVLKAFLHGGEPLVVERKGNLNVRVNVQ
jgi:hypothetical protein